MLLRKIQYIIEVWQSWGDFVEPEAGAVAACSGFEIFRRIIIKINVMTDGAELQRQVNTLDCLAAGAGLP